MRAACCVKPGTSQKTPVANRKNRSVCGRFGIPGGRRLGARLRKRSVRARPRSRWPGGSRNAARPAACYFLCGVGVGGLAGSFGFSSIFLRAASAASLLGYSLPIATSVSNFGSLPVNLVFAASAAFFSFS